MDFDGLKSFKTDKEAETGKGVDLHYDDIVLTVRRAGGGNLAYNKAVRDRAKRLGRKLEQLSEDQSTAELAAIYADTVIVGWSGVKSSGVPVEFNRQNVIALLTQVPDLFGRLVSDASNKDLFLTDEDAPKN